MDEPQIPVRRVTLDVCELCLAGDGGQCYVPGCAFWMSRAPNQALRGDDRRYLATALQDLEASDWGES